MYTVFAVTAIGEAKVATCHPLADSPLKVTLPNWIPVDVHKYPMCVPILVVPL